MSTKATYVFKDHDVVKFISIIHDKYVVVPAYKPPNKIVLICTKHHIDYLKIK
jgi:hypothetical protein